MATVQSNTVTLNVAALPVITVQPLPQTELEQDEVTFSVTATGTGTLLYQWYEVTAGLLIGETATTLVFDATLEDEGEQYYVIVTDDNGSTQSNTVLLTVLPLPVITVEPADIEILDGEVAAFTVTATGTGTITYQWYGTTEGLLAGETAATISTHVGYYADSGQTYYVIVSDDNGGFTQSINAFLTVTEPGLNYSADLQLNGPNGWIEVLPRMKYLGAQVVGLTYFEQQVVSRYGVSRVCVAASTTDDADIALGSADWITLTGGGGASGANEIEVTATGSPTPETNSRLICTNPAPIVLTLTGYTIGSEVAVVRTDAPVNISSADLINGETDQDMPLVYDSASLVLTLAGWIAL